MADDSDVFDKLTETSKQDDDGSNAEASSSIEVDIDSFTRPGAQITDKQTFKNLKGETITGYPVIVDFRRLLQLTVGASNADLKDCGIIPGISNRDLLHAVVGLYDVSLSEMTPDVLYATVCEKWARTIILVRDVKEALAELEDRRKKEPKEKEDEDGDDDEAGTDSVKSDAAGSKGSEDEDVFECDEDQPSKFSEVYSDTASSEEDDEDDDEEDFSKGINSFIHTSIDRRKARKSCDGLLMQDMLGVENLIIGCATFEKKYVKHKDRVIHLTLVTVRKRCRKFGIGKFLLSQLVEPKVVGHYDAIVVHADNAAIEFFQKFGFSDDIVLNSRWKDLAEQFTNCTLMCYLPGFTGHKLLSTIKLPGFEVAELEQEFLKWKERSIEVYQQQVSCMMRMKHEVLQLKYTTATQNKFLEALVEENDRLKTDKLLTEKELLDYRLITAATFNNEDSKKNSPEDQISTQELIDSLQKQVDRMDLKLRHKRTSSAKDLMEALVRPMPNGSVTVVDESQYMAYRTPEDRAGEEPYDHVKDSAFFYEVTEQFEQQMKLDSHMCTKCEVASISKALVPDKLKKCHRERLRSLKDPIMVIDLYYCGTLERPERIQAILKNGFSQADFTQGEYGKGLYFSKYPSKAAQFSSLGNLLKAEVGIGAVETVIRPNRLRTIPSPGYDSIIVPGRISHKVGEGDASMNQEYVVFDVTQVIPLCLLSYKVS